MLSLRGYISSRRLEDNNLVDQSVQNLIIRRACEKYGYKYMLSATEYGMMNCFLMLNQVVKDSIKGKNDGIAFYSIEQLPKDAKLRREIYNIVLKNKKKIIFSLEDMVLENKKDINNLENLIKIKFLLNYSPKTFDI